MSLKLLADVWETRGFKNRTDKLLLLSLADQAWDSGEAFITYDLMCVKADCNRLDLDLSLTRLQKAGLIRLDAQQTERRARQFNESPTEFFSVYITLPAEPESDSGQEVLPL